MWNEFLKILQCYPQLYEDLNCKCTDEDIHRAEETLAIKLPEELRLIYLTNNGQKGDADGIFKSVSGYNKYTRPKFHY
jgi:cell wall assembly regulator SMI1